MNLNKVQLPAQLIADLYQNSLVENHATTRPISVSFRFLGSNEKNILIAVNNPDAAFLTEEDLTFLSTVLGACKLSLADVAIINTATQAFDDYHLPVQHFSARVVLLFDIEPAAFGLPLQFPFFQIQKFEAQTYLAAPSLSQIAADKTLKAKLWNALKTIFGI